MSQNRTRVDASANDLRVQGPGDKIMSQDRVIALTTVGAGNLPVLGLLSGIINRSGPTGAYIDTLPDAAALLAAAPQLNAGDSFSFRIRNTAAFVNTLAVGVGVVLGFNTAIAASLVREYLVTVLAAGAPSVVPLTTTNASAAVSGLTTAQAAAINPGMGVTGTGIPASTTVVGVNMTTNVVTLSAAATATGSLVPLTFFPRYQIDGIASSTL